MTFPNGCPERPQRQRRNDNGRNDNGRNNSGRNENGFNDSGGEDAAVLTAARTVPATTKAALRRAACGSSGVGKPAPRCQMLMSRISKWIVPAGTVTSTRSPFFLPSSALAMGVPIESLPSRRLASFSETIV